MKYITICMTAEDTRTEQKDGSLDADWATAGDVV